MKHLCLVCFGLLLVCAPAWAEDDFLIHDGDRVVIWGDSITDNAYYPRSMENYALSRFSDWTVEFHNLGWGGDRTTTLERMKRDLPQYQPTFVTIKLGMNDGQYTEFKQENYDAYIKGYRQLLDFLRSNTGARIVLITTVTYELDVVPVRKRNNAEIDMSPYPETLRRFSEGVKELAQEYKTGFIDLNALYAETLTNGKKANPDFKLSGDAIHPNVNGQAYMAYHILKGLNAPALVADIGVDAQNGAILWEKGAYLRNLKVEGDRLSFTRCDRSLPFHFSGEDEMDSRFIDKKTWYNELNRDWLVVKNQSKPYALLTIDDEAIAVLSKEQLEEGINLSLLPKSPMLAHGALIADLTNKRHDAEYARWRRCWLQGVRSPYDFTPYKPESVYSKYLGDAAKFYHCSQLKYNDPAPRQFLLTGGEKEELEKSLSK
ncbi:MAG: SGNH/GDSL hydrolase family protein [Candidatus Omnitrophota bacterium]